MIDLCPSPSLPLPCVSFPFHFIRFLPSVFSFIFSWHDMLHHFFEIILIFSSLSVPCSPFLTSSSSHDSLASSWPDSLTFEELKGMKKMTGSCKLDNLLPSILFTHKNLIFLPTLPLSSLRLSFFPSWRQFLSFFYSPDILPCLKLMNFL